MGGACSAHGKDENIVTSLYFYLSNFNIFPEKAYFNMVTIWVESDIDKVNYFVSRLNDWLDHFPFGHFIFWNFEMDQMSCKCLTNSTE
jgi:hypothetical protein